VNGRNCGKLDEFIKLIYSDKERTLFSGNQLENLRASSFPYLLCFAHKTWKHAFSATAISCAVRMGMKVSRALSMRDNSRDREHMVSSA